MFSLVAAIGMFAGLYQDLLKPMLFSQDIQTRKDVAESPQAVETKLALRVEQAGVWNAYGGGRYFQFTLSNPGGGLALVDAISVDVVDVLEEDYYMLPEALPRKYDYTLTLTPHFRGLKKFAEGFSYAGGDVDRFGVLIDSTPEGCDYFFRFRVDWYDDVSKTKHTIFSHVFFAKLADGHPASSLGIPNRDTREYSELYYARERKIWARLDELRKTMPHSPDASHP
ncbi:MAG: hypothetical protein NTW21_33885 [Verrucomicrobia bacterium]|nr:hypothetical protein [Verrucomicrobiota bacterium]